MNKAMPNKLHTVATLEGDLRRCGWQEDMHIIVHTRFRAIGGYVCGGAEAMIIAMLNVLGEGGTLIMPTHTTDNSDPYQWQNPPVPEAWWQTIRETMPAFDSQTTPTRKMGILADTLRRWHGMRRSNHPQVSFTAVGKHADFITAEHPLDDGFGDGSPLARLYDVGGHVFLLGVGHANNTALHLAEYRADFPDKQRILQGSAVRVDGERQWLAFYDFDYDADDFEQLGADFEAEHPPTLGRIGEADVRLMPMRPLVDFGVRWLETNRHTRSGGDI